MIIISLLEFHKNFHHSFLLYHILKIWDFSSILLANELIFHREAIWQQYVVVARSLSALFQNMPEIYTQETHQSKVVHLLLPDAASAPPLEELGTQKLAKNLMHQRIFCHFCWPLSLSLHYYVKLLYWGKKIPNAIWDIKHWLYFQRKCKQILGIIRKKIFTYFWARYWITNSFRLSTVSMSYTYVIET